MGLLIVMCLFAVSCWGVFGTFRRLRRIHAGRAWWFAFAVLALTGVIAGTWLALRLEYWLSPETRFFSFPVPLAFFRLERGHWVDFVTPPHVMYPGLVANIVAVVAAFLMPLLLTSVILHTRQNNETRLA